MPKRSLPDLMASHRSLVAERDVLNRRKREIARKLKVIRAAIDRAGGIPPETIEEPMDSKPYDPFDSLDLILGD